MTPIAADLAPKKPGLLRELVPNATAFAVLTNPDTPEGRVQSSDMRSAPEVTTPKPIQRKYGCCGFSTPLDGSIIPVEARVAFGRLRITLDGRLRTIRDFEPFERSVP
jgi:hypothetical protein